MPAERERRVPVEVGRGAGHVVTERPRHHVRGGVRDALLERPGGPSPRDWFAEDPVLGAAVRKRQLGDGHGSNGSSSTRLPSREEASPASASCTPRAADKKS